MVWEWEVVFFLCWNGMVLNRSGKVLQPERVFMFQTQKRTLNIQIFGSYNIWILKIIFKKEKSKEESFSEWLVFRVRRGTVCVIKSHKSLRFSTRFLYMLYKRLLCERGLNISSNLKIFDVFSAIIIRNFVGLSFVVLCSCIGKYN